MKRQSGFTLVEVLIAFAILAVVMVALYEAAGTGLRSFEAAASVERAVLVAQSRMDRIVAQRQLPAEAAGTVDGTPFTWQVDVLPLPEGYGELKPQSARLQLIRLRIRWPGNQGQRSVAIERIVSLATGAP